MNPETITPWIEHLNNPFVLAGFAIFILASLAGVIQALNKGKLSGAASERLLSKLIFGGIALGVLAIGFGFLSPLLQPAPPPPPKTQSISNIKDSTVSQGGCEAVASNDGQASIQGQSASAGAGNTNQKIDGVENSTIAQGGCNAASEGESASE